MADLDSTMLITRSVTRWYLLPARLHRAFVAKQFVVLLAVAALHVNKWVLAVMRSTTGMPDGDSISHH